MKNPFDVLRNPELQRQLWLRWSPWYGVWLLLFVALAALLVAALSSPGSRLLSVLYAALIAMCVAPMFPGASQAGLSLQEELTQNTWDWQRLSALGPWQMAWGKLLGSTLPMWLLALVCAVLAQVLAWWAYWDAGAQRSASVLSALWPAQVHAAHLLTFIPELALLALLWGLALQAFAMASVPMRLDGKRLHRSQPGPGIRAILLLMLGWSALNALLEREPQPDSWRWWGLQLDFFTLGWLLGAAALGLSLLALWRTMGMRLDVPMLPWATPLGCTLAAGVLGGLTQAGWEAGIWLSWTAALALVCGLFACYGQRDSAFVQWRRVQADWAQRRWRAGMYRLPLWPLLWCLAAVATWALQFNPLPEAQAHSWPQALPLLLLALLREAGFIHLWALPSAGGRRIGLGLGFVWTVSSIVLPLMLLSHHAALAVAFQPWLAMLMPQVQLQPLHWLILLLQLAALASMVWWVWQRRCREIINQN